MYNEPHILAQKRGYIDVRQILEMVYDINFMLVTAVNNIMILSSTPSNCHHYKVTNRTQEIYNYSDHVTVCSTDVTIPNSRVNL